MVSLNIIIEDLSKHKKLIKKAKRDLIFLHFGIGTYIRNKYLWNNKNNIEIFSQYYNVNNVDDISNCIVNDLLKLIK